LHTELSGFSFRGGRPELPEEFLHRKSGLRFKQLHKRHMPANELHSGF
jgi:hypothetical protein